MSSTKTVYLNLSEISEVHEKDVFLKDVAKIYCSDPVIQNKCNAMKVYTVRDSRRRRYVQNVLDVIRGLEALDPSIQVNNVGKVEYIIDYQPPEPPKLVWEWAKTIFVCLVCFFGAAFAIMTFNNDVNVQDVFGEIYQMVVGQSPEGVTIMELAYTIGLSGGIVMFFNHFAKWKVNTDPTPLEVEMRLYEENISKTLIQNSGRKEQGIDVQ